jgi:hypothetical protein
MRSTEIGYDPGFTNNFVPALIGQNLLKPQKVDGYTIYSIGADFGTMIEKIGPLKEAIIEGPIRVFG